MASGTTEIAAAVLVGGGLSSVVVGILLRADRRRGSLLDLLDLAGDETVPVEVITESPAVPPMGRVTARLGDAAGRLDRQGSLEKALAAAGVPLRPGEYLILVGLTAVIAAAFAAVVAGTALAALPAVVIVGWGARLYLLRRSRRRGEAMRAQLPDAFSLIASAVASGHTFLRSIQLLKDEIDEPLAGELHRAVAEVVLGSNLIDALERMAARSQIDDLRWAVQAVRIQQTTGGQLAEILRTLAEFMRARQEVHREVRVLSAEGRFSAFVLLGLPLLVTLFMELTTPSYLRPFFRGWGLVWLAVCAAMLVSGYLVIRRLIDIEV